MCVVSMIYDHFHEKWNDLFTKPGKTDLGPLSPIVNPKVPGPITPEEIVEFRKLLERAREYDKKNNQPDCESEEKRKKVKELADLLGVDISFI